MFQILYTYINVYIYIYIRTQAHFNRFLHAQANCVCSSPFSMSFTLSEPFARYDSCKMYGHLLAKQVQQLHSCTFFRKVLFCSTYSVCFRGRIMNCSFCQLFVFHFSCYSYSVLRLCKSTQRIMAIKKFWFLLQFFMYFDLGDYLFI